MLLVVPQNTVNIPKVTIVGRKSLVVFLGMSKILPEMLLGNLSLLSVVDENGYSADEKEYNDGENETDSDKHPDS